ncbi:MAG: hypothetical protein QOE89_765, partial [Pseudonocardiales bacterium]|nr:hypothetical protein [Pseudonocardiales bacterium]
MICSMVPTAAAFLLRWVLTPASEFMGSKSSRQREAPVGFIGQSRGATQIR